MNILKKFHQRNYNFMQSLITWIALVGLFLGGLSLHARKTKS